MTADDASKILLIEDTPSLQLVYETLLTKEGFEVTAVDNGFAAEDALRRAPFPIALLDLTLPDGDGLEYMESFLKLRPETKIIVLASNASINGAVKAMRAGAVDFLIKPFNQDRMMEAVRTAQRAAGQAQVRAEGASISGLVGTSAPMREVQRVIAAVAPSKASVFLTGESGTGKEITALAIHDMSPRATAPFVPINCGAIPGELLESELFGHLKGSFTGAISDKEGSARTADGGTLFLDEICEMDVGLQTKLLRFIETGTIRPVGSTSDRRVDVRIICATNRDPMERVKAGAFREDLYYRLNVLPLHLPPLRTREDDVLDIAFQSLQRFSREENKGFQTLSPAVEDLFRAYSWPGNVRQLNNLLRRIVVLHDGREVEVSMLPLEIHGPSQSQSNAITPLIGLTLAEAERALIEATIARVGGSLPKAADILDVSPSTLYRKREAWRGRGS